MMRNFGRGRTRKKFPKREALRREIETWEKISSTVGEELDIARLAEAENNKELEGDIKKKYEELKSQFEELEFLLFRDRHDRNNAIVAIHAGTGGTDAQDWAEMLLRMILRYCERRGFSARIVDEHKGGEAGIKSAIIDVQGEWAYGYLKSEHGVHRLVRISPFDAEKMRHTSFSLIEVLPEIGEVEEAKIDPKDLRIDTYLAGGARRAVRANHLFGRAHCASSPPALSSLARMNGASAKIKKRQ